MKIYWSHKSYPELVGLSPSERRRIWRSSYFNALKKEKGIWFGIVLAGLSAVLGSYIGGIYQHSTIGAGIGGGIGGVISSQILAHFIRPYLKHYASQKIGG